MILADGEDVRDLVPMDDRIRLVHLADARSIGEKRNFGCGIASGDVICHWDDDDWSEPERLADQVDRLGDYAVSGYHSMRFSDGVGWWKYEGTKGYALGTSLCYRRSWWQAHPFEAKNVGEDNAFVSVASSAGRLISVDAGNMMYATIHTGNTSPRMMGDNWKPITEQP